MSDATSTGPGVGVAVCQLAPILGDVTGNVARACDAAVAAERAGAEVVVLPELVVTGYMFADRAELHSLAEPSDGPSVTRLAQCARDNDLVLVGGFAERCGADLYNSAFIIDAGGLRAVYRKVHLWDRETELFAPGSGRPPVVETRLGRIATVICYDLEFPEWSRTAALSGADLLCVPTNWPIQDWPDGEHAPQLVHAQAAALASRLYVAVCDRAGVERGQDWTGGSGVVSPHGYPQVETRRGRGEQTVLTTCDLSATRSKRTSSRNDAFADRRPDLYAAVANDAMTR